MSILSRFCFLSLLVKLIFPKNLKNLKNLIKGKFSEKLQKENFQLSKEFKIYQKFKFPKKLIKKYENNYKRSKKSIKI